MQSVISKQARNGQQLEITVERDSEGFPTAAVYLDGKRIASGGVVDNRAAVRPAKLPEGCTHIVAGKAALPTDEGERVAAALAAARIAHEQQIATLFPGLDELKTAEDAWDDYKYAYAQWVDEGDGINPPRRPTADLDALRARYPAAARYLRAKSYERSSNVHKYGAGKRARAILESGGNPEEAQGALKNWLPEEAKWD